MRTSSEHSGAHAAPAMRSAGFGARIVALAMLVASSLLMPDLPAQAAGDAGLTARILLFSGRPDPTFEITDPDQIAQLRTLVQQASPVQRAQSETVTPSRLGYRGFLIENPGKLHDLPARIIVYKDALELGTEPKQFRSDPGARLESFLLDLAVQRGVIPEKVLSRMREKR